MTTLNRLKTYGIKVFVLILITYVSLLVVITETNAYNSDDFDEKRVLFISSYSPVFNTFFLHIDGLQDAFEGHPVTLDIEFMDSKRFLSEENITNFYNSLSYKMDYVAYDMVIVADDNGLNFVMQYKDDLFVGLPVIFFGINNETNAAVYSSNPLVTGFVEKVSLVETINLALALNPNSNRIVAISDETPTGAQDLSTFYQYQSNYSDVVFEDINLSGMSFGDMLIELENLDKTDIVLLLAALKDVDGTTYDFDQSLERIVSATSIPIYHLYEHGIGDGLLGGKVVSHYDQAYQSGMLAIDIFNGTSISSFESYQETSNQYIFDYRLLEEYDYDISKLPSSVIFVNRDLTFFEENAVYIYITLTITAFLVIVISVLTWSLLVRNKALNEVEESKEALQKTNESLKQLNQKLAYNGAHDHLTGLFNRNYYEEYLETLDKQNDIPISIILGDVNGLKLINDAFGHMVGDQALIQTAQVLKDVFSNGEVIARIGGDEFAIVLLNEDKEYILNQMRETSERAKDIQMNGVGLSLSLGYSIKRSRFMSFNDLFTEAEDLMYRQKLNQVPSNRSEIIDTVITTINQKDEYSEIHSQRVSKLSEMIARLMNFDETEINQIKTAGLLHDVGKIIVPSHILNKDGKLTEEEYQEIQKHSEIGYRILNSVSTMREISEFVFTHHERIDGKGYPRGLTGEEIPIQAKIIAVADAIDAMLTDRLYRARLSQEKCIRELEMHKGTQFCSDVVDVVVKHFQLIYPIVSENLE